ncbi:MAG: eukaryotic-like serine/threonine-protein kinase [Micromonosporaceae bacterium]
MSTTQTPLIAGRYRLAGQLGQGGMGRVWLGRDEVLHRDVAMKEVTPPEGLPAEERAAMEQRSLREARAIARLAHPNVVRVYDIVQQQPWPWIVMEHVPSRSLDQVLRTDGPLALDEAARIGLGVLSALRAAHRIGMVHRDVKPGNVLLGPDGRVVLTDFGLAMLEGDATVTRPGVIIGSPAFMAPERAARGASTPECDLWSLGATLHAAVEGQSPYARPGALATLTALATEDPDPAPHAGPLREVIDGLLRRDPDERMPAAEVQRRLRAIAGTGAGTVAPRQRTGPPGPWTEQPVTRTQVEPVPPAPAAAVPRRRRAWRNAVVALLAVAGLAALLLAVAPHTRATWTPGHARTTPGAATPGASRDASPPGASAPASPPDTGGPALPQGWHRYRDRTGFSVAVPDGWTVSRRGSIVYFRDPGGSRLLGIDQTDQPQPDPVADWTGKERYRVANGDFPGYQRVKIAPVPYFVKAADWEFTYLRNGQRTHVVNRGVITSPHQAYGFWWQTADSDWSANLPGFRIVTTSFQPRSA